MIKFEKTPDEHNEHDHTTVSIMLSNESTLTDVYEAFKDFLKAMGYHGVEEFFDDGEGV